MYVDQRMAVLATQAMTNGRTICSSVGIPRACMKKFGVTTRGVVSGF